MKVALGKGGEECWLGEKLEHSIVWTRASLVEKVT